MNLEIDISAMNNLIQSPKVVQRRKYRKPKKTTLMEFLKKGEFKIVELTEKEKENIDAITKYASLNDLILKFYKIGIIVAYVYFEAFNKDMMKVLDNTSSYERFNILLSYGKNKYLPKFNKTFDIELEEQFVQWKSLIEGYAIRNMIVHNNGRIDEKFSNEMLISNGLTTEDIDEIKNLALDYKQAFESIIFVINVYTEFILEKTGVRVCCVCKKPFEDEPENLEYAPVCQECRIKSIKKS